jgi:glutathione S-transferase
VKAGRDGDQVSPATTWNGCSIIRRWLAGDRDDAGRFRRRRAYQLLDYISDVDWTSSQPVKDWYAKMKSRPAFRSILSDQVPGFAPPPHYANLDF